MLYTAASFVVNTAPAGTSATVDAAECVGRTAAYDLATDAFTVSGCSANIRA